MSWNQAERLFGCPGEEIIGTSERQSRKQPIGQPARNFTTATDVDLLDDG